MLNPFVFKHSKMADTRDFSLSPRRLDREGASFTRTRQTGLYGRYEASAKAFLLPRGAR